MLGRVLAPHEVRDAMIADSIINLYRQRATFEVEIEWAIKNPDGARVLEMARVEYEKLCQ